MIVAAAIAGITVLAGLVKRIATVYTITDRRLNIKRGIIARKVQETRMQRVQNVNFNQGVYERAMQIGDVEFTTAGTEESNFVFAGVGAARAGRRAGRPCDPRGHGTGREHGGASLTGAGRGGPRAPAKRRGRGGAGGPRRRAA